MASISNISDSRGGGVDSGDGAHVEQASVPSYDWTPTNEEIRISMHRPWESIPPQWCAVGSVVTETRGGGETIGHYGLLSCRWGIPRGIYFCRTPWQFLGYLRRSPCHILCLQEADEQLKIELTGLPNSKFIGIRTPEEYGSLMICARKSVVLGMRLLFFERKLDGTFVPRRISRNSHRLGIRDQRSHANAFSRTMIVRAKMKHFIICGGGAGDIDDVTICNVHCTL